MDIFYAIIHTILLNTLDYYTEITEQDLESINVTLVKIKQTGFDEQIMHACKRNSREHGEIDIHLGFYPFVSERTRYWWWKQAVQNVPVDEWHISISASPNAFRRSAEFIKETLVKVTLEASASSTSNRMDWRISESRDKNVKKYIEEVILQGLSISE